jgi:hypothetical protein
MATSIVVVIGYGIYKRKGLKKKGQMVVVAGDKEPRAV